MLKAYELIRLISNMEIIKGMSSQEALNFAANILENGGDRAIQIAMKDGTFYKGLRNDAT